MKKKLDIMDTLRAVEPTTESLICAIDPGSTGGVIILTTHTGFILWKSSLPIYNKDSSKLVDFNKLCEILSYINSTFKAEFIVEDVGAIQGQRTGKTQQFAFAHAIAVIDCCFKCCNITPFMVKPQVWQASLWSGVGKVVKRTAGGMQKTDTKATSLKAKERLYPDSDCRVSDRGTIQQHNYVDALLIAMYLTRIQN